MLECQRHLFQLPDDIHYLNCASRAPLLASAEQAGIEGLRQQRSPESPPPDRYFAETQALREALAGLLNCDAANVALTPSVSYGVGIAAHNVKVGRQSNIVFVEEEFPSNVYAWLELARESGASIREVPRQANAAAWNTRLLEAIDSNTAVVSLSSVHWTDGLRFDLEAVSARCRETDALFVLDGTQSIGAQAYDHARVQPDLLVGACYKWLLGPYQLGYAVVGPRLLDGRPVEQHWSTRAGAEDTSDTSYRTAYAPGARRFDVGEQTNPITVPMALAALQQLSSWGVSSVSEYCSGLAARLGSSLDPDRFTLAPEHERYSHILGIRAHDEASIPALLERLDAHKIRISRRAKVLRVSPNVYNTVHDIDALVDALRSVKG